MRQRRGVTLLEAALSVALLAGVVATIVSGYSGIRQMSLREQEQLNATELAHRLVLIYTNQGPSELPPERDPIEQGGLTYTYELAEEILIDPRDGRGDPGEIIEYEARGVRSLTANQRLGSGLVVVTITIYPFESRPAISADEPLAELARIFYPLDLEQANRPDQVLLEHVRRLLGAE